MLHSPLLLVYSPISLHISLSWRLVPPLKWLELPCSFCHHLLQYRPLGSALSKGWHIFVGATSSREIFCILPAVFLDLILTTITHVGHSLWYSQPPPEPEQLLCSVMDPSIQPRSPRTVIMPLKNSSNSFTPPYSICTALLTKLPGQSGCMA